jgi:hypothetical protein
VHKALCHVGALAPVVLGLYGFADEGFAFSLGLERGQVRNHALVVVVVAAKKTLYKSEAVVETGIEVGVAGVYGLGLVGKVS